MKTTSSSRPLTLVHDSIEAKLAPLKILVIDDQSTGRIVLSEIMRSLDASLEVATFADPLEGIEYARKHPVDMVLTDYKMPSLDGIEVIRRLRRIFGYEDVPIVCITVVNDREVRYRALEAGATDFLIRPIDRLECGARCRNLLSLRRHEILKKNRTRILEQKIDEATRELRRREVETLFRLAKAAEQRDKVTGMHLVRMAKYSSLIAKGVGLSSAEQDTIELAAPMHDIGKIGIPDRILQNPGKLDGGPARHAVPRAHRLRHAERQLFRIPADGRGDRARPSREVRRDRLSDRLEGRSHPARGAHRRDRRRLRRADLGAPLQVCVARQGRAHLHGETGRPAFRSAARGIPG